MIKKENSHVRIIALGGAGEIGKNMYVIEIDDEAFIIDAGLKFPESEMYGVDMVIPDFTYITENKDKIKAIFISHGHEDHIGALGYVLDKINVPIYGTRLTLGLLKDWLQHSGSNPKQYQFRIITPESKVKFDSNVVSFIRTAHNIPGSVAIVFKTSLGSIIYTSDFKLDPAIGEGKTTDVHKISTLGHQGVLCLLSDSTNAERPGFTPSEAIVGEAMRDVMQTAKGRIIITTFATNVYRVSQVVDAAIASNRKLVIVGQSMKRTIDISQQLGYLEIPKTSLVPVHEMDKYEDNEIVMLTTGAQGEPMQALVRISKGANKFISIKKGDTVVVSATSTAGDELSIYKAINKLTKLGANVIYNTKNIHVSGHGSQEELKLMIQMAKPKYFIPVQGEYRKQKSHAKLATQVGIPEENIHIIENGDALKFTSEGLIEKGKVVTGNTLIDGLGVGDVGSIVLRDRRLLSQDGILVVVVTLDKKTKRMKTKPEIITRGFVYVRESEQLIEQSNKIVTDVVEKATSQQSVEWSFLKSNVRESLTLFLYEKTKRRPMILPIVLEA